MGASDRRRDRGTRRGFRNLRDLGGELREKRHAVGLSQQVVADAAGVERARLSRIEAGSIPTLGILEAARIAAVLGLDLSVRCYPGGESLRDEAQVRRLEEVRTRLAAPLRMRLEVPLPRSGSGPEQRAWDAVIDGAGMRTRIEVVMRLADAQAQARAIFLKARDDPDGRLLVVVADTAHNRRTVVLHEALFSPLDRLVARHVLRDFRDGRHPGSGWLLL